MRDWIKEQLNTKHQEGKISKTEERCAAEEVPTTVEVEVDEPWRSTGVQGGAGEACGRARTAEVEADEPWRSTGVQGGAGEACGRARTAEKSCEVPLETGKQVEWGLPAPRKGAAGRSSEPLSTAEAEESRPAESAAFPSRTDAVLNDAEQCASSVDRQSSVSEMRETADANSVTFGQKAPSLPQALASVVKERRGGTNAAKRGGLRSKKRPVLRASRRDQRATNRQKREWQAEGFRRVLRRKTADQRGARRDNGGAKNDVRLRERSWDNAERLRGAIARVRRKPVSESHVGAAMFGTRHVRVRESCRDRGRADRGRGWPPRPPSAPPLHWGVLQVSRPIHQRRSAADRGTRTFPKFTGQSRLQRSRPTFLRRSSGSSTAQPDRWRKL